MTCPHFSFVPSGDHEIHVTEWGSPDNPALVMWHGLVRTGRDFDELAAALSDQYFVLCPDTIGRGLSSWAKNPETEYRLEFMTGIARDMLDHYAIAKTFWLGTSMGGLIGMWMASGPLADRLSGLILNDVGPEIPQAAIKRIMNYVADLPVFERLSEAQDWLHQTYKPFGKAPDSFWRRMARTSVRRRSDGKLTLHYDARIMEQFSVPDGELPNWERFGRIATPLHVLRGENSDMLTPEIAQRMSREGRRPDVTIIADCGHAPALANAGDAASIRLILDKWRNGK